MNEAAKRCPFCGGRPFVPDDKGRGDGFYRVQCTRFACDANGPIRSTVRGAVRAWNKRTADKSSETLERK